MSKWKFWHFRNTQHSKKAKSDLPKIVHFLILKFGNFSATQILREISSNDFRSKNFANLAILGFLQLYTSRINNTSQPLKTAKNSRF